jgi:hypothetical protein
MPQPSGNPIQRNGSDKWLQGGHVLAKVEKVGRASEKESF